MHGLKREGQRWETFGLMCKEPVSEFLGATTQRA